MSRSRPPSLFPYTTLFRSRHVTDCARAMKARRGLLQSRPGERLSRAAQGRSEEHTSELQSRQYLVCRLLLEKQKDGQPVPAGTGNRCAMLRQGYVEILTAV